MIIDTHHHLWKYNESDYTWMSKEMMSIRRDFLVSDLVEVTRAAGISGTIVVQARQSIEETEWLLKLASDCSLIQGVVGWVPLCSPDVEPILERLRRDRKLKGVRHVLHDEPDEAFMLRKDFNRGVGLLKDFNLIYDVLIFERHLPQTIEFIDRHPEQVFVLDHIAKPLIRRGLLAPWSLQIRELAKRENVFCKISGMVTEADWGNWNADQLRPYFDAVVEAFGPKRIMFGSDWPVVTLAAAYCEWVNTFRTFLNGLSPCEQESICSETAIDVYGLGMEPSQIQAPRFDEQNQTSAAGLRSQDSHTASLRRVWKMAGGSRVPQAAAEGRGLDRLSLGSNVEGDAKGQLGTLINLRCSGTKIDKIAKIGAIHTSPANLG